MGSERVEHRLLQMEAPAIDGGSSLSGYSEIADFVEKTAGKLAEDDALWSNEEVQGASTGIEKYRLYKEYVLSFHSYLWQPTYAVKKISDKIPVLIMLDQLQVEPEEQKLYYFDSPQQGARFGWYIVADDDTRHLLQHGFVIRQEEKRQDGGISFSRLEHEAVADLADTLRQNLSQEDVSALTQWGQAMMLIEEAPNECLHGLGIVCVPSRLIRPNPSFKIEDVNIQLAEAFGQIQEYPEFSWDIKRRIEVAELSSWPQQEYRHLYTAAMASFFRQLPADASVFDSLFTYLEPLYKLQRELAQQDKAKLVEVWKRKVEAMPEEYGKTSSFIRRQRRCSLSYSSGVYAAGLLHQYERHLLSMMRTSSFVRESSAKSLIPPAYNDVLAFDAFPRSSSIPADSSV